MTKETFNIRSIGYLKKYLELSFESNDTINTILKKALEEGIISNTNGYLVYCPQGAARKWFENDKTIEDYHIAKNVLYMLIIFLIFMFFF